MRRSLPTWFAIQIFALALSPTVLLAQIGDNPTGPTGVYNGNITTAGSYDPWTGNQMRVVDDIVVPGSVGAYPLKWTRYYNSNVQDGQWTFSYKDYKPNKMPDGRQLQQGPVNGVPDYTAVIYTNGAPLWKTHLADGGIVNFVTQAIPYGYVGRPTELIDPYGHVTRMTYLDVGTTSDGVHVYELDKVIEPGGRFLQITWSPPDMNVGANNYITRVEAFDGRGNSLARVDYFYIPSPQANGLYPLLDHVNYADGTTASYTWAPHVVGVHQPDLVTANDVRYDGPMRQIAYSRTYSNGQFLPSPNSESNLNTHEILTQANLLSSDKHQLPDGSWTISQATMKETRADNAERTFTYAVPCTWTQPVRETLECDDAMRGKLISYTDFLGHVTQIDYDTVGVSSGYIHSVTDPNNLKTTYTRNGTWNVTKVDFPDGSFIEQTYTDPANPYFLASRNAQRGPGDEVHATIYTRGDAANPNAITRKDYPDGGYEKFFYNGFGQVTQHVRRKVGNAEEIETYEYDGRGLKIKYTDGTGGITDYAYYDHTANPSDAAAWTDRLKTVTYPPNASGFRATQTYEYDHTFDSNGNETTTPAPGRGLATKVTYADGSTVVKTFNKCGDMLTLTDELGHTTAYTYDDYGRVLTVETPKRDPNDTQNHTTTNSYVPKNFSTSTITTSKLPWETILPSGKNTTFEYDPNWRKTFMHVAANAPAETATTEYRYDEGTGNIGHLTTLVDPRADQTTYGYDLRDRQTSVKDALGHMSSVHYDTRGVKDLETHANGEIINYDGYDAMNRLTHKTVHRDNNPPTIDVTSMSYDFAGNLISNTDEDGNIYTYAYDNVNRRTSMIYPRVGGGSAKHEDTEYDLAGNVRKYINRAGAEQTFSYDSRNRQTSFTWSDGTSSQTTVYDAASRKTDILNADAYIKLYYNDDNTLQWQEELVTNVTVGDNVHRRVTYAYDPDGNRSTVQYPSGTKFDYDYTQRNQVADIKLDGQQTPIVSYGFDPSGNIRTRALDNGTSTSYVPDAVNRDTSVVHSLASEARSFDYVYNEVNDVKAVKRDANTPNENGDAYEYDLTQQIKRFAQNGMVDMNSGTIANPATDNTMKFDGCGNRTQLNGADQHFNELNQPDTGGFGHDTNGNLTDWNGWTYSYDAQNRLRHAINAALAVTADFYYDGLNRQVARVMNGSAAPTPTPVPSVTPSLSPLPTVSPIPTVPPTPTISPINTPTPTVPPLNTPTPTIPPFNTPTVPPINTPTPTATPTPTPTPTPPPPCAPVTFSVANHQVSMSTTTAGATIFYTYGDPADPAPPTHTGSTPDSGTSVYNPSQPVDVQCADAHFKAIAYKSGMSDSNVTSYQIDYSALPGCGGGNAPMSASSTVTIFSVWDGDWAILEEYDANGNLVQGYVQGYHGLVKTLVDNIYYYQDELGSTSHIADANGALIEYYKYDLYGKPTYWSAITPSSQLVASAYGVQTLGNGGSRWMPEIGLYDDRNRFMSPELGRFLQPDPVGFKGDASNLYRYCGNDWASRTDPLGLADEQGEKRKNPPPSSDNSPWTEIEKDQLRACVYAPTANAVERAQNVSVNVNTTIRDNSLGQAGMKTNQTVNLNQNGAYSSTFSVGTTNVLGAHVPGVSLPPVANVAPVKGSPGAFKVTMAAYAASRPLIWATKPSGYVLFSIHYSISVVVNFANHTAFSQGRISGYPTSSIHVGRSEMFHHNESRIPLIDLLPFREVSATGHTDNW